MGLEFTFSIMVVRRSREEWKTYGNVFDTFTERNIFKLTGQGYFSEMDRSIALGKEANIFSAIKQEGERVIVKIYRLENCNFNKMYDYLKHDPRYVSIKTQRRKIIFAWTQREYRNLLKAREVIRVPMPITFKDNIILMEQIGFGDDVALQLKISDLPDPKKTADTIFEMVKKLFDSGLVHGDLSEFNILIHNEEPVFIDFSQSTTTESMNAPELLKRDIEILCAYFKRKHNLDFNPDKIYQNTVSSKK